MKKDSYWFIDQKGVKSQYCYFIKFNKWLKIGVTTDLVVRYNAIRFSLPEECYMLGYFKFSKSEALENYFIQNLTDYSSTRGEWVVYDEYKFNECVSIMSKHYCIKLTTENE